MTPYYEDGLVTLYHGDCRDLLPRLSFDAIVTDPPYGSGSSTVRGDEAFPFDVLPPSEGPAVAFGSARLLPSDLRRFDRPPDRVMVWAPAFALSKRSSDGILFRWDPVYVWGPVDGSAVSVDVFRDFEPGRTSITKPVSMMRALVSLTAGTVLDPFAGSGSTLRAAKDLGRRAIGVEIEERFCEAAALRLAQEVLDFGGVA